MHLIFHAMSARLPAPGLSLDPPGSGNGSSARSGGAKKVRKAGGVVWDGLRPDGKRLKLVRCAHSPRRPSSSGFRLQGISVMRYILDSVKQIA